MDFSRSEVRRLMAQEDAALAELGIEPDDSGDTTWPVDVAFLINEENFCGRGDAIYGAGGCFPINEEYLRDDG